jgi:hypothetical protein
MLNLSDLKIKKRFLRQRESQRIPGHFKEGVRNYPVERAK